MHRLDERCCELKRLYVRPEYRGQGLSRLLMEQCIGDARRIGYQYMRLDTLPFMTAAMSLYKEYGFYEIPPYYDNPIPAIFMQKDL
nr:GNAT family N-acetyltransferase [Megasphaera stantonii]